MHTFRVWAPSIESLAVEVDGTVSPMKASADGWWSATVSDAGPGSRYGYRLNGDEHALPDPRSPWQPDGVHGLSCIVDHSAFRWTDANWQAKPLASALIYELHIGTFTPEGTYRAAAERLDHLASLGVTHVELMPVNQFSGQWGWGYDGVDLYAPHRTYGTPDDLKSFVDEAHGRGLAVLLDVVYNHLGPAGNYLSRFGPYFTTRHRTPWGEAVNLDGKHSHEVRRFFCDNALMWLRDYHFDGLRIDAVHALLDSGATHFVEELATEVSQLAIQSGRYLALIGESDLNDPRVVRSRETGGYGLDAQWSDDFHHALHSVLTGENGGYYCDYGRIGQIAKALQNVFVYDGAFSRYRQRPHGRPVLLLPGYRFLGYIQNHDQIGNRAKGERISHIAGLRRAQMAAGLVLTSPFVPMLFQGEEWAASTPFQYFTQHEDIELGRAVSEGRRSEFVDFGWNPEEVPDPQDPATFQRSKLRWNEIDEPEHRAMLEWHRSLIRLRRSQPDLTDGHLHRVVTELDETARWLTVTRGSVTICCNFADTAQCLPLHNPGDVLLASGEAGLSECGIRLGPETLAVVGTQTSG
jgi:maltooligosyltrehalose trehalohydrolase